MRGKYKLTQADKEQVKLFDVLEVQTSIMCDKNGCNESDMIEGDPLQGAEEFYFKGWRVNREGYARCPKHAPKTKVK